MGKEKINMLETIFEAREEDLAFIDEKDKKFMSQDKANKIKKSDCLNKEFDPNTMEAVLTDKVEGVKTNIVIDVLQKGYTYRGKVIRHAMVKVAE